MLLFIIIGIIYIILLDTVQMALYVAGIDDDLWTT